MHCTCQVPLAGGVDTDLRGSLAEVSGTSSGTVLLTEGGEGDEDEEGQGEDNDDDVGENDDENTSPNENFSLFAAAPGLASGLSIACFA